MSQRLVGQPQRQSHGSALGLDKNSKEGMELGLDLKRGAFSDKQKGLRCSHTETAASWVDALVAVGGCNKHGKQHRFMGKRLFWMMLQKKSGSGEEWQPVTGAESRAVTSPNHEAEIVNQKRGGTISSQVPPPGTYFLQQGCLSLKDPQPSPKQLRHQKAEEEWLAGLEMIVH